jgi:hypothetical protein
MSNRTLCKIIIAGVPLFFLTGIGCSKPQPTVISLLTPEKITEKELKVIKNKGLLDEKEELVLAYTLTTVSENCIVLTNNKLAIFKNGYPWTIPLENIFDMTNTHSTTPEKNSAVVIYKKDNSEFNFEFKGGSNCDELFFANLLTLWRAALDNREKSKPASDSSTARSSGDFFGIQKKPDESRPQ